MEKSERVELSSEEAFKKLQRLWDRQRELNAQRKEAQTLDELERIDGLRREYIQETSEALLAFRLTL